MKLDMIQLGDPVEHRGIVLCPLFPRRTPRADYITLEVALPLGFRVSEIDEAGSVPELAVHNPVDRDVLLHDGEELLGAKQNRILNVTVLVGRRSQVRIPVSCVEEGRWHSRSAAFVAAPHAAHPELRRRKNVQLLAEPLARGVAQHVVWDEVRARAESLGAVSPTGAQSDTFTARAPDIEALRGAFPLMHGQSGALLVLGESFCLDFVSRPDAWTRLYPKLLEGYLLDALSRLDGKPIPAAALEQFMTAVAASATRREPSAARGEDLRLSGERVIGSGLALEDELLQLSAFSGDHSRAGSGIARPSRRR